MSIILLSLFLSIVVTIITLMYVLRFVDTKYTELFNVRTSIFQTELNLVANKLLEQLEVRRVSIENKCYETLMEHQKQIETQAKRAKNDDDLRLLSLRERLAAEMAELQKRYAELDKHFRENQKSDVTRHLLSCAYAVALSDNLPQTGVMSDLVHAVLAHQKEGLPTPMSSAPATKETLTKKLN